MSVNVMVDIETLGTRPGSVILSIGAVTFGASGVGNEFYRIINTQTCLNAGLELDPATLDWWASQSPEARATLNHSADLKTSVSLARALSDFREYLAVYDKGTVRVWGNGSNFDNVLIAAAYRKAGDVTPWNYLNDRCYRTLKNLEPDCKPNRTGTFHSALDDAKTQAEHAIRLHNRLGASW